MLEFIYLFFIYLFFWPHHVACGVLVPQPGIALALLPAWEAQGLNHLAIREVLNVGI